MLIAMAGLPASGKSAVASKLASHLNSVLLDKDHVREFLFKGAVDYERKQDDLCLKVIYDVACYHLAKRPATPVILDGRSYSRNYQVEAVKNTAVRAGVVLHFIECVCSSQTARLRLESDRGIHVAEDRDYALYERSLAAAEVIVEPKLILDTEKFNEHECTQIALSYIENSHSCR